MRQRARPDLWEPRVSNHPRSPGSTALQSRSLIIRRVSAQILA